MSERIRHNCADLVVYRGQLWAQMIAQAILGQGSSLHFKPSGNELLFRDRGGESPAQQDNRFFEKLNPRTSNYLTHLTLEAALELAGRLPQPVFFNLSPRQARSPNFISQVLHDRKLPEKGLLVAELSENCDLSSRLVAETIKILRKFGVVIALDDINNGGRYGCADVLNSNFPGKKLLIPGDYIKITRSDLAKVPPEVFDLFIRFLQENGIILVIEAIGKNDPIISSLPSSTLFQTYDIARPGPIPLAC